MSNHMPDVFIFYFVGGAIYLLVHYLYILPLFRRAMRDDNWAMMPYATGSGPLFLLLWPVILCFDTVQLSQMANRRGSVSTAPLVADVPATLQRLDSIIVPRVDLREADLHAIVEFLNLASRQSAKQDGRRGVQALEDWSKESDGPATCRQRVRVVSVTCSRENISLLQLIKELSALAQVPYAIYGDGILVFGAAPSPDKASPVTSGSAAAGDSSAYQD